MRGTSPSPSTDAAFWGGGGLVVKDKRIIGKYQVLPHFSAAENHTKEIYQESSASSTDL